MFLPAIFYIQILIIFWFFENHDTDRFNEIFNGNPAEYKLALSLISTVRGIPQIYYGSEIGMMGDKPKLGDGDIRRDFPGGWKNDSQNAFNPDTQTKEQKEFYDFTQKILNWRKNNEVIHTGKTKHYLPENGVYVYFRFNEKGSVMVVLNNNEKEQTLQLKRFEENLKVIQKEKISFWKRNFVE
jgi:glycosidase